ncbi:hypothetical protein [Henriciella sp.]|uniref:hypothetical protein n=1 Tax=Henriciella sp. TaxID=1968823 RepID=UPI0026027FDC|nr:hypothetical protein [Henriciella sp.]
MADEKRELRVATKAGHYNVSGGGWRIVEKGEQVYVPVSFKASWLEKVEDDKSKPAAKAQPKTEEKAKAE